MLFAADADSNARETPLHWASSCDDVAVLDGLLDATAFAQRSAAFLLVEMWRRHHAVRCGYARPAEAGRRLLRRGRRRNKPRPTRILGRLSSGRLPTPRYLAARSADVNWIAPWAPTTPLDGARRTSPGARRPHRVAT